MTRTIKWSYSVALMLPPCPPCWNMLGRNWQVMPTAKPTGLPNLVHDKLLSDILRSFLTIRGLPSLIYVRTICRFIFPKHDLFRSYFAVYIYSSTSANVFFPVYPILYLIQPHIYRIISFRYLIRNTTHEHNHCIAEHDIVFRISFVFPL